MKHARGKNKLFQNATLLMCFCSFATLKTQSVRHAIKLLLKVKISLDHPRSNTNWSGIFTSTLRIKFSGFYTQSVLPL